MKKMKLLVLFIAIWAIPAMAGTVVCSGTVLTVAYDTPDRVMLRLSSMDAPVYICSLSSVWSVAGSTNTTDPATCRAFFDMLLSAQALGATVTSMYFDGDSVPAACDQWGAWKTASVRYFQRY